MDRLQITRCQAYKFAPSVACSQNGLGDRCLYLNQLCQVRKDFIALQRAQITAWFTVARIAFLRVNPEEKPECVRPLSLRPAVANGPVGRGPSNIKISSVSRCLRARSARSRCIRRSTRCRR